MKAKNLIVILLATTFIFMTQRHAGAQSNRECVVLLHGLARSKASMSKLADYLDTEGFSVVNIDYPSRKKDIQTLSQETITKALSSCDTQDISPVHFVTHSMGGILIREYLEHQEIKNLGRVVMLSPPNKGSEVVDKLKTFFFFKWLNGPAGQQLGTDRESVPNSLGPAHFELGIITGDRSVNLLLSRLIPGTDDGKVSVENAKLGGMKDFLVVHATHPFIMKNREVMAQVVNFLKNGMFLHSNNKVQ